MNEGAEADKAHWEVEKLKLETRNLQQPFRRQPASWFAVATIVLSLIDTCISNVLA
jgi:hypothetical protein